jgi:hypothetical protein
VKIETSYWRKPIPPRCFDWQAVDGGTYDGEGCPIGYGATEQEAIVNLLIELGWPSQGMSDADFMDWMIADAAEELARPT